MKIGQIIKEKGASLSFEFFPPKEKAQEDRLFENITKLEKLKPDFVSVTYGAGGGTSKNTSQIIKRIKRETKLLPMPHLTCINQGTEELVAILEDYKKAGIENLLALRGDPPEVHGVPIVPKDVKCHANELEKLAAGVSDFSIGVAGYPEGHLESPDLKTDMKYMKLKVDAGAEFIITQMFFDNRYYYGFVERCEKAGINVPVIPGIMPIVDISRIKTFCDKCGATLPDRISQRLSKLGPTVGEAEEAGIEIITEQCADLMEHGVPYFHFFTLNQANFVTRVINNLGLRELSRK